MSSRFRFHGYGSLKYVYKNGKTLRSPHFAVKFCPNPRRKHSRVAVVVGKKIAKKAVERNRIRRRLFEAIRLELPVSGPAFDIVATAFDSEISKMDFSQLQNTIRRLFKTAQIS